MQLLASQERIWHCIHAQDAAKAQYMPINVYNHRKYLLLLLTYWNSTKAS